MLAYDLRAHGRSERPSRGYLLRDFTSDLRELLDGTGITGPVHLVGNSSDGTVAFGFAARCPERVARIVAIEAEPPTATWSEKMERTLNGVVDGLEAERYLAWVEDTFGPHHARLARAAAKIIRATSIIEDAPSGPLLDDVALASLACPVLSIVGSEGFQSEDLHCVERLLPNCRTEVITTRELLWAPGAGGEPVPDRGADRTVLRGCGAPDPRLVRRSRWCARGGGRTGKAGDVRRRECSTGFG